MVLTRRALVGQHEACRGTEDGRDGGRLPRHACVLACKKAHIRCGRVLNRVDGQQCGYSAA